MADRDRWGYWCRDWVWLEYREAVLPANIWIAIVVISLGVAITIWDVVALSSGHPGETVSAIIGSWAREYPVLAFAFGWLACHLLRG